MGNFTNTAQGQAFNQATEQYRTPINTISQLFGLTSPQGIGELQTPNFQQKPADMQTAFQNQYLGQIQSQNAQNQQIGQAASLAAMMFMLSDERAKQNIEPIGKTYDNQDIYSFNYKGSPRKEVGLLAQEVQDKYPDAVHEVNGIKFVDYGAATQTARAIAGIMGIQ
jgi:hypothetical protein